MNKKDMFRAFDLLGRGGALAIASLGMKKRADAARHLRWLMLWERTNNQLPWLALKEEEHGVTLLLSYVSAQSLPTAQTRPITISASQKSKLSIGPLICEG